MLTLHKTLFTAVLLALFLSFGALAKDAQDSQSQAAIRHVMMATWDAPDSPLEVGPIVVLNGQAVASWAQGSRGGRAFLQRKDDGTWYVAICAGDGLKDPPTLVLAGMSNDAAQQLVKALLAAEALLPQARRDLFASFEGMLEFDSHEVHSAHQPASHTE